MTADHNWGQAAVGPVAEHLRECLDRKHELNSSLRTLVHVDEAAAMATAALLDKTPPQEQGPLHGMVVSIKDNVDVAGMPTTLGSEDFRNRIASKDAEAVFKLRRAGAIVLGKAHMHAFAMGTTSINTFHGTCRNPLDPRRLVGGSSGGSAGSVAAGMCDVSLGTDTGGSIRIPAALTGQVGFRPTWGRVSAQGMVDLAPSFDTIGPVGRDVATVARVFSVLDQGRSVAGEALSSLRLGIVENFVDSSEPDVQAAFDQVLSILKSYGVQVRSVRLPGLTDVADRAAELLLLEGRARIAALVGSRRTISEDVMTRFESVGHLDDTDLPRLRAHREQWEDLLERMFHATDLLLCPTVPRVAPLLNEVTGPHAAASSIKQLAAHTQVWAYGRLPALALPMGVGADEMPCSLQIIGAPNADRQVLKFGALVEQRLRAVGPATRLVG